MVDEVSAAPTPRGLLRGRRALVVGGGGGLGSAIARALVAQECRVAVAGRNIETLAAGVPDLPAVKLDLQDHALIAGAVGQAADALGGLDLLVNAAGSVAGGRFEETSLAQWRQSIDIKLLGTLQVIRAALPHLKASRGTVLTLTGLYGKEPAAGQIISGAINAALANSHKALASDLARDGVRVLSLCIGGFLTDRLTQIVSANARRAGRTIDEQLRHEQQQLPLGRYGRPEELADIVVMLASSQSAYLTGAILTIDGGAAHAI